MKIRAKVLDAARRWLNHHDYLEVHGPTIVRAAGAARSCFEVKYFDKKAYLTQGLQPHASVFVANLGRIYTIAPAFRAEKVRTRRHLTEYWRIETAQPSDLDTTIGMHEALVAHICQCLAKEAVEELQCLQRNVKTIMKLPIPFPRLTYDAAIERLQGDGYAIQWGQELNGELAHHISQQFKQPFFITDFPISIERFFYKSHPERPELTLSAELCAPEGYGEIAGGAQMIDRTEILRKKMRDEEIAAEDQRWYLGLTQHHRVPHSGFMIGLERLIQWICNLEHISETSAFPRLPDTLYP